MRTFNLLVALFALVQAFRYGRGALLFLLPSRTVMGHPGLPPPSPRRARLGAELEALGFVGLGRVSERGALGLHDVESDVYASLGAHAYADVIEGVDEGAPGVLFSTPFADGAMVMTAGYRRPPGAGPRLQVGSMPGASPGAALAAHEVAVRRFATTHGAARVSLDLEERLTTARAWLGREGRRELRRVHAFAFGIVLVSGIMLLTAVKILLAPAR